MKVARTLTPKDINALLDLSYKAVFERGLVGTDFNKQNFNFQVKNLLISAEFKSFGLFVGHTLMGFAIINCFSLPWSMTKKCLIYLLHLDPHNRTLENYQILLDTVTEFCAERNVHHIVTCGEAYLLDEHNKHNFFIQNNFTQQDTVWEKQNDS